MVWVIAWLLTLVSTAHAQQSLFNVPSGEVTPKKKLFFQEQLCLEEIGLQSNSVLSYGLGADFEVGVDFVNLNFDKSGVVVRDGGSSDPLSPALLATGLVMKNILSDWKSGLGFQLGTNIGGRIASRLAALIYWMNVVHWQATGSRFYLGGYLGSAALLGTSQSYVNFMAGLEQPILENHLHFVADHIHGDHGFGLSVIGLAFYASPMLVLSAGVQIPNNRARNPYGVVLELTLLPLSEEASVLK